MKLLIAYLCHHEDRDDYFLSMLPVGTVSLAAFLEKKGHSVTLANFSKTGYRAAARRIREMNPRVVGVSLYTHNRVDSIRLIREIKKELPRVFIMAGGPHASGMAETLVRRVPEIDLIIRGEAEDTLARALAKLEKNRPLPGKILEGKRTEDLDRLPAPCLFSGDLIDVDRNEQFKCIVTSRGCTHRCAFCCSPALWGRRITFRSAGNIIDEIEHLYRTQGIIFFSLRDDNFTQRRQRVLDFCRMLRERKIYIMWNCQSRVDTVDEEMLVEMKRAGLEQIQFGVESGSPRILKAYDKSITVQHIRQAAAAARRAGVYLFFYLMTGMTGETASDTRKTVALIRKTLPGDGMVSPVALYPGTGLYDEMKARGKIDDSLWFKNRQAGVYLRDDPEVREWTSLLVQELGVIRERSWYRARDFVTHRRATGPECWVTDILEGDYHMDGDRHPEAARCYVRVTADFSENPWGHMRMGKLRFRTGDYESAERSYAAVTRIVPGYYGGWLKMAECQYALKKKDEAAKSIEEARRRNSFDFRIDNLRRLLRAT